LSQEEIEERVRRFREMTSFELPVAVRADV
jgi:hypothetical protein